MNIAFSIIRSENPIIISIDGRLDAINADSLKQPSMIIYHKNR